MRKIVFSLALAGSFVARGALAGEVYTSTSDVRACVPREDGTTIAATTGGLAIASGGKIVRTLTSLDGLPDTKTNALLVDGNDLWVGTDRGLALTRMVSGKLSIVRTLASSPVRAIASNGGTIYVGTFGDGVQKLSSESGPLVPLPFVGTSATASRKRISSLAVFDGSLYAGTTGGGLLRVVDSKMQIVGGEVPSTISSLGLHDNRLYVGAIEGLVSIGKSDLRREGDKDVRAIASLGSEIWLGTYGAGLMHPGKGGLVAIANAPKGASLVQAIGSRGGTRCLGTANGLFVSSSNAWSEVAMSGPPSNDVTTIARDGDKLWVGTYDKGLATLENGTFKKVVDANLDERINVLAQQTIEGKSRMWVATTRGLDLLGGKTTVHYNESTGLPASDIHSMTTLAAGGVLIGTAKGAAIVQSGTVTVLGKKQGLAIEAVWAVAEGTDGTLYLGTSSGLHYRKPKQAWQRLSVMSGHLKDDWITALVVKGDTVLVGTYAGGVSKLVFGSKEVTAEQWGGGYVNLAGVSVIDSVVYAATMDGLLTRAISGDTQWKKLPKASLGIDVTAVIPASDGLFVASRRGIARVKP